MRTDKNKAIELRKAGKSYRAIERETGIARSTLTRWFKGEDWNTQVFEVNNSKKSSVSRETMQRFNLQRKLSLQYEHALAMKQADHNYQQYKNDPLFIRGITLYACHGDLVSRYSVSFSTANTVKQGHFLLFMERYLQCPVDYFSFKLAVYEDSDYEAAKKYWLLAIPMLSGQWGKVGRIKRQAATKALQNGISTSIMTSAIIKATLLRWIALVDKEAL